jgi:hypothetical protein
VVKRVKEWHDAVMRLPSAPPGHNDPPALGPVFTHLLNAYAIFDKQWLPHDLLTENREVRMQLLAGVIDSHACVKNDSRRVYEVGAKNRRFLSGFIHLAQGLGFTTGKMHRIPRSNTVGNNEWRVTFGGSHLHSIETAVPSKRFTQRPEDSTDARCTGFVIQRIKHARYYGFELDGNGRCLLSDFVVTHNSSYCRTAGLNVLMAQMGSFIPASSATVSVVDAILSRIGAGDSTARAQSTFLVEMLESAAILRQASSSSFVIVDELGRGTSVDEGYGIAEAIAHHLAREVQCFTFFATHYHELTELANEQVGVVNKHVCVHETASSLTMLYTLADGPSDRSYGIHVAKLVHFPQQVIDDATRTAKAIETFGDTREEEEEGDEEVKRGTRENEQREDEAVLLDEQQQQLLTAFRRSFVAADKDDPALLAHRLREFKTQHAALVAAAVGQNGASVPPAEREAAGVAAMDESS